MDRDEVERKVRWLEDIQAIKGLKARYAAFCDDGYDADGIASLFVPDGVWDGGPLGRCEGTEGIRRFFLASPRAVSFAIHHVLNRLIEVDGDRARGQWYLFQPCTFARTGSAIWMAGRYADDYVRVDGLWLFETMRVSFPFVTPFHEGWAKTQFVSP